MRMLLGNLILLAMFLFASKAWATELDSYEDVNSADDYDIIVERDELVLFAPGYTIWGKRVANSSGADVFKDNSTDIIVVIQGPLGEDYKGFDTWSQLQGKFVAYDLRLLIINGYEYKEVKLKYLWTTRQ